MIKIIKIINIISNIILYKYLLIIINSYVQEINLLNLGVFI